MHPFENLKELLFGSQRPWLPENTNDAKYRSLLLELKEYEPIQNLNFELKFLRHINDKTQFYVRLIQNQKLQVLDQLIPEIINEQNPQVSKFLFNSLLTKQLQTFIKDIGKVLKEKNFDIGYINPKKNTFDIDSHHKSNAFIIQYLKFTTIQIYLELQRLFQITPNEELIEDDFYTTLLFEPIPDSSFLSKIIRLQVEQDHEVDAIVVKPPELPIKQEPSLFNPIKRDLANIRLSKVNFGIIKNEEQFALIETNLYEYRIIDIDYNFIKNKASSNSVLLAATIKVLIEKNYFRKGYAGFKGTVRDNDIREFLENRYNTDIKQQFRRFTEENKELALRKLPWLDSLPSLR
ncbi:DUF6617 family protein [Lacihabitans soyangensis]|uniref:Uncharacterized protein n=1 Tax=Lacihabitans soyangensis TaxID=869394 RepID=A0AAE3GYF3_9BACT|nr:DUF6617 family protein [Lacihabitans soyangensis]MCP9761478.1 hypothetical protein [Lacihabitans soyangensis]